jgi:hypothetical protein
MVGVSQRTVKRGGLRSRGPHPNREKVTAPVAERRKRVPKALKKAPRSNSQDIADVVGEETGVTPTKRTAARDLKSLGVRHLTCDRAQRLSEAQMEKKTRFRKAPPYGESFCFFFDGGLQ